MFYSGKFDLPGNVKLLKQTHSDICVKVPEGIGDCGDAWLISKNSKGSFGIKTADCLAIIVLCENEIAVIHAGWKGLANNIIKKTLENLKPIYAVVGPHIMRYEVGIEVLEQIEDPIYERIEGRYYLNLARTAEKQLSISLEQFDICTFDNNDWCSYRREKDNALRNLAVISLDY